MDTTNSSSKIKVISLGLMMIIPITVQLGFQFILPISNWFTYENLENEYLEKNMPNYNEYKKLRFKSDGKKNNPELFKSYNEYKKKYTNSKEYKDLKEKDVKHSQYRFITSCFLVIAIISSLICINVPIIHLCIMIAGMFLFISELNMHPEIIHNSYLSLLKIITSLICLILTIYIVKKYKD